MRLYVLILLVTMGVTFCEEEKVFRVSSGDSYLEAYKQSHSNRANVLLDNAVQKTDREYVEPNNYPYPAPQDHYGPPPSLPVQNYGPSAPGYGPPTPQYGPPNPVYGPPSPVYGPPSPAPAYGPPGPPPGYGPPSSVQVFYGMPHALGSIWDKLKFKLDLFTLGKILLKLVIFKKIVSLIAILCLLLFIPSLKDKMEKPSEDEDSSRRSLRRNEIAGDERLNTVTANVLQAIDIFEKNEKTTDACEDAYCKTQTKELLKKNHIKG